jgi:hypothetical protein
VAPLLQSPAKNSTISGATTFSWTAAAPKPTDYELYLGTGYPGSSNLKFSLIPGSTTSESVTIPANGATVYMTLRYQLDGTWYTESFTFKEAQ